MLTMLAVVLVVLWLLGFVAFHVSSSLIHLLLVFAVIAFIVNMMSGRKRLA